LALFGNNIEGYFYDYIAAGLMSLAFSLYQTEGCDLFTLGRHKPFMTSAENLFAFKNRRWALTAIAVSLFWLFYFLRMVIGKIT
jgi:hypothetical protein